MKEIDDFEPRLHRIPVHAGDSAEPAIALLCFKKPADFKNVSGVDFEC